MFSEGFEAAAVASVVENSRFSLYHVDEVVNRGSLLANTAAFNFQSQKHPKLQELDFCESSTQNNRSFTEPPLAGSSVHTNH